MSKNKKYRSSDWFDSKTHRRDTFVHRGWMRNQGHPTHLFDGRPVIGICNTWSELTPCNGHFKDIAEYVRRGVYEAGGFPLEFPVFSASESNLRPTAMLFRNLASMDVEEAIRGNPMDGVVLLMGCDKTTPSLLMGAASCDLPTIGVSGGPMLNGQHQGDTIGSGTGVWKLDADLNAGLISEDDFVEAEISMSRSKGHCMTMGTASTMASMVESLGMALPHNAAIPAVDARRYSNAFHSGKRIVEMVKENLIMSKIVTKESFENAIKVNGAVGGSTNAVIHMAAIAGRMEIDLTLDDWERCGKEVPTLVNLQPSGTYLMEDFYYAGGLPAVLNRLLDKGLLYGEALTVNGKTIKENNSKSVCWNDDVIRTFDNPLTKDGGIKVLKGNIAPDGAILKPSAASPHLMQHTGKAVVFESIEEFHNKIHDPNLDVDENSILVINKSELLQKNLDEQIKKLEHVLISIIKNSNLDILINKIINKLKNKFISSEDILITRERHRQHLVQCSDYLKNFNEKNKSEDFDKAAEDLRLATRHLGMIVGKVGVEEILGSIFNDFCIGK